MEKTVWICPEWCKENAVCINQGSLGLERESNDEKAEITIFICPEHMNCGSVEGILYLLPDGKTAIDCSYCHNACTERTGGLERDCRKKEKGGITWEQYSFKTTQENEGVAWPYLDIRANIPRDCNLTSLYLYFSVLGKGFYLDLKNLKGRPPDDDYYPAFNWFGYRPGYNLTCVRETFSGGNTRRCECTEINEPLIISITEQGNATIRIDLRQEIILPGDFILLSGIVSGEYIPVGSGYYETPIWTSGVIKGAGLIEGDTYSYPEDEITPLEGGEGIEVQDEWLEDERLAYLVEIGEQKFWIRPSDFSEYQLKDRVFIAKLTGDELPENNMGLTCRDEPCCPPFSSSIINSSGYSYMIVPQIFAGS